jgi:hypothetical protein
VIYFKSVLHEFIFFIKIAILFYLRAERQDIKRKDMAMSRIIFDTALIFCCIAPSLFHFALSKTMLHPSKMALHPSKMALHPSKTTLRLSKTILRPSKNHCALLKRRCPTLFSGSASGRTPKFHFLLK